MFAKAIDGPPRTSAMSSLTPYVIAVASTAAAVVLTSALWPANRSVIVALYYPAVFVSTIYGNRLAAALAITLSALSTYYLFLSPDQGRLPATEQAYVLVVFCIVSSLIALLIERAKANERMLRESEELFRKAFHSNPAGMAISRASDGRYVEMNDTFGTIIGRSRQQTIGSSAIELGLVSAEEREHYIAELSRKGSFRDRVFVIPHLGGEARQVLVTERKRAEDALRRIETRFRHVMDTLPVGAYTCDAEGRITYFNERAARLWGRKPRLHDMTERFCGSVMLLSADDTPIPREQCRMARALATGQSYGGEEITIERPDATRVTVLEHVHPLPDVSGGQPGAISVLVDITDRKHDQETLREQAALLDNAQRIGRMGSWNLDLRTGRLAWPDATCRLFGIAPSELAGTFEQFHAFILPEDVPDYDAANARLSPSEPLFEAEYRIRRPDGVVRWMYSRGHLEVDATGAPIARTGIVMDMTEQHVAGERLAETVAMLRIAGRVAHLGGWTIQLPSRTLTWSDETCAIHDLPAGYKPTLDEGIGYYPAEYRADVLQHVEACERDGTSYDFEVPKITATGRRIWVRSIGEAVRDADGRIVGLQGAFQDISTRRQAEGVQRALAAELETERARLIAAQAVASIGSWESEFSTGALTWSAEFQRILGGSTDQLQHVHPDDRSAVNDAFTRSLEQHLPGAVEYRLLMPDGRITFVEARWQIVRDEQGEPARAIGTCQDITDRRQAQESIRMQAHMLDQIGQAVIATDPAGVVTYANRFAAELYGWAPAEMLGRAITEVTVPQATRNQGNEIVAHLQRGETWSGEFLVQSRQGRVFPAHVTDSPVLDERGHLIGIVGISTDITARKQAEDEARQKDALIRIAGRLTHTGGWAIEVPGDRVFWSDELFDILDYERGRMPPLADALALYPDPDRIAAAIQACQQDGTPFDLETEILTAKGARKWVRVSGEAERHANGSITRVQGAFQDTTEHKHLEQQYLRA
jgi:PAS domain S-box-containing protein